MKSRVSLPLILLAAAAAPLGAQPYDFGPSTGPGYPGMPEAAWEAARSGMPMGRPGFGPSPMEGSAPMGARPPMAGPVMQASAVLKEGMDKLMDFLAKVESTNNLQVAAFLDREIAPYFDFDYMAQWVAGAAYGGMTKEERKALAAQLESDFLSTLARNLAGFDGQQIEMLPPRRGPRGAVSINVAVMQAGSYPTRLQFKMSDSGDGWKVYDVVANGQSAASYYRVQFQRMAREQLGYVPR